MGAPEAPQSPGKAADLSRLRIQRDREAASRSRGFPWVRIVLVAACLAALWVFRGPLLALVSGASTPAVRTGTVVTVDPRAGDGSEVSANGYVVADRTTSVSTVRSGRLVELSTQEGRIVPANSVVARIQYDDLEAEAKAAGLRAAAAAARVVEARAAASAAQKDLARLDAERKSLESQVAEARETEERLARDVERNRTLYEQKRLDAAAWDRLQADARAARMAREGAEARVLALAASRTAWEGEIGRREAALAVATADEGAALAAVEVASIEVEKTKIRAPFEGLVIRKDAEVGEVIAPTGAGGRGSVITIVDPSSLEVQVELSERRIARVAEGGTCRVFLDADPDTGHAARVRKIWPRADRTKGTIEVRVTLDERPAILRPEMAARVVFLGEKTEEAGEPFVGVPVAALRGDGIVFVLERDTVRRRAVKTGERRGDRFVVLEGLAGGETVVLDPPADLADGDRVRKEGP